MSTSKRPMTREIRHRRTVRRLGLALLSTGAILAVVVTTKSVLQSPVAFDGGTPVASSGNGPPTALLGELHYQLWKRNLAPAGLITTEIDFRLRRGWTESPPRPVSSTTRIDLHSGTPPWFDLPDPATTERVLASLDERRPASRLVSGRRSIPLRSKVVLPLPASIRN